MPKTIKSYNTFFYCVCSIISVNPHVIWLREITMKQPPENDPSRAGKWKYSLSRRMQRIDRTGVSPILGTMLILLLMVTMITSILLWAAPLVEDFETANQYNSMKGLMETFDRRINYLTSMGENTSVSMDIVVPPGSFRIEKKIEFWTISFRYINSSIPRSVDFIYENFSRSIFLDGDAFSIYSNFNQTVDVIIEWMGDEAIELYPNVLLNTSRTFNTTKDVASSFTITILNQYGEPLSKCLVFPVNSIIGEFICADGRFALQAINGGIISEFPDRGQPRLIIAPEYLESFSIGGQIPEGSNKVTSGDCLILNIMNYESKGIRTAGKGNYGVDLAYTMVRPYDMGDVRNVRLHVYGSYQQCMYNGFTRSFSTGFAQTSEFSGFIKDPNSGTLLFRVTNSARPERENTVNLKVNEHFFEINIHKE